MSSSTAETDTAAPGLAGRVGRGLGWSLVNNIVGRLGSLIAGIVLARLLVPSDYGAFAVALVVLTAGLSMNELGVSLAIVRWPDGVDRIAPTVATLAIAWSAALYAICFLAAPSIASAMNVPAATGLIRTLAVGVLVDAAVAVPSALITRHFLQRRRMFIDLGAFAVGTALSIVLAIQGLGAWAMVCGFLGTTIATAVLVLILAPTAPPPGFSRAAARELLHFGLPLAGASMLMFLMLNLDYVVVGHQLGASALGFYLIAFNLCSWPVNLVSAAVRRVSFAGFARVGETPDRGGRAFADAAGMLLAPTLPLCALLAVYAEPVIETLYGSRWLPAVEALQLLCVLGAARILLELGYDFVAAVGHTRTNLWLQGLWLVLLVPALVVGARWDGLRGVATAHAVVAAAVMVPAFLVVLRSMGVPLGYLAQRAVWPALAGLLVLGSAPLAKGWFDEPAAQMFGGGAFSASLALVALLPLVRRLRRQLVGRSATPI